ncbi:MAG: hypothetical protein AB4368_10055 [Xenococcaceae cyanobacterium]
MNNTKKSELKQALIAALSTFPCPVTVPEILHQLAQDGQSKLTRPELTELLEEMTSKGETQKFPVNRYACHHVWTATNQERRCSRCHRLEPIKPTEDEAMNTDIEIVTDSKTITAELLEEEEEPELDPLNTLQQEKEELLRIESELRTIQEDFIVKSSERYQYILETKLYQSLGYNNFKIYCSERLGISYRQVYRLIDAARVLQNLKGVTHGSLPFPLPTSERQCRVLAQLETASEQFEVWQQGLKKVENGKIPSPKDLETIIKQQGEPVDKSVKDDVVQPVSRPLIQIESKYGQITNYSLRFKDHRIYQALMDYAEASQVASPEGLLGRLLGLEDN